jgi:hypothetical protein
MAKFEIAWEAPEFEYREKSVSWYWLSIIVAAVIVAFSVWEKNFLFGLFIIVAEVLFLVWGNRTPRMIGFRITETGLEIEKQKLHLWKDVDTISVDSGEFGFVELVLIFRAKLRTPLKILFPEEKLAELRTDLKGIVREVPYEPTLLDSIEKLTRF